MELAVLPLLPAEKPAKFFSGLFPQLHGWDQDALLKLTILLGEVFASPGDFGAMAEPFVAMFEEIPPCIRAWFEVELALAVCPVVATIIESLAKTAKPAATLFCRKVKNVWLSLREVEKTPPKLVPEETLL
jgi:hypothetical protein